MIDFNKVDKKELFNHYCNTLEREVDLKQRINKAIEFIEEECLDDDYNYCCDLWGDDIFKVLNILKGSDKE